jgi:hypothetical protein
MPWGSEVGDDDDVTAWPGIQTTETVVAIGRLWPHQAALHSVVTAMRTGFRLQSLVCSAVIINLY